MTAREAALKILYEIQTNHAYTNICLNKYLKAFSFIDADKRLITELVYGSVKYRLKLDYVLELYSKIRLKKLSPWILNIMRLGIYQILFLDKIPTSAVCNESVKLAKKYGHRASAGFVNATLRAVNATDIKYPNRQDDSINYLSVNYSYPRQMVERWVDTYGFDFTEKLCAAGNEIPPLTVRTNTLKITPECLMKKLSAQKGRFCDEALITASDTAVISELFNVQDESSMLASKILDPSAGDFVIDVCCAPGGKITHIAQLTGDKGNILGWDIHPHKIKLTQNLVDRLGISSISLATRDALIFDESLRGKADKVLVDAPCSGLGVIRRKPDLKWNSMSDNLSTVNITDLQQKILSVVSGYVKTGGSLVYSTCTIEKSENIDIVNNFLKNNRQFQLSSIQKYLPDNLAQSTDTARDGYIQLYPHIHGTDGFFICKLEKRPV